MNNLSKEEEHILLHSLGWSNLRWYERDKINQEPYRNYFYTSRNTVDYPFIISLIEKGLMFASEKTWEENPNDDSSYYFCCTEKGIDLTYSIARNQIEKSKPTRSKRRYECYLHSESDASFIDWLRSKYWNDYRKRYGC
jgi:hypothetical protein